MLPKATRIWALICLVLALQLAAARSLNGVKRDDGAVATSTIPPSSSGPAPTGKSDGNGDGKNNNGNTEGSATTKPPGSTTSATTSAVTATFTSYNPFDNSTFFNTTIPEGQLPIQPTITPGWGVAGIIMITTGLVYTLIGIKNRWIHSFFSTAYIAALGVTVLIVYVMNVPISNAVQGGYVVAIIMSGCALGAASMFFKELTEGLGCALGGFCVSMWLLCLVPGGLLTNAPSKAIFIASFTVIGFAFYFSRWTRDWALIVMISFGGATVTVLGIDCYSTAGLKEFWAYVWNLNDNLFPLGATTYPVTKGIRVETAAILIICLVGIISQIKLWRIVREKREKRAAERAEGQRNLEEEEENVGRQIEETTARERREWERVYGDGTLTNGTASRSDVGDMSSEKKLRSSQGGSTYANSKEDGIEMADMSDSSQSPKVGTDGLMSAEGAEEGKITIRVATDEVAEVPAEDGEEVVDEKVAAADGSNTESVENGKRSKSDGKRSSESSTRSKRASQKQPVAPAPEVVPLPFKVPVEADADVKSIDERSSVATFADEEEEIRPTPRHRPSRHSLVKRLSQNSATLLRSFSQRSKHTNAERQLESGESVEELVEPTSYPRDDDRSSLAATVDNESVSGDDRNSILSVDNRKSIEITAELGKTDKSKAPEQKEDAINDTKDVEKEKKPELAADEVRATDAPQKTKSRPVAVSKKVNSIKKKFEDSNKATEITEPKAVDAPASTKSSESKGVKSSETAKSSKPKTEEVQAATSAQEPAQEPAEETQPEPSEKPKSVASAVSGPVSLTKDRLPKSLSKIALSYRTNEWAKHLSNADAPEPDEIYVEPIVQSPKASKEVPRSVDVEDLQKTAEDGALPPAMKRSDSQVSQISSPRPSSRIGSKKEALADLTIATNSPLDTPPTRSPGSPPVGPPPARSSSVAMRRTSSGFAPIAEENHLAISTPPIPEEAEQGGAPLSPTTYQSEFSSRPPVPGVVSYASPQTLLGQRETFLRNKSQGNLLSHTPEPQTGIYAAASDEGSLYNYPMYATAFSSPDPDDLPLSHRRDMMRQSSMMSLPVTNPALQRSNTGIENSENTAFNSHQPKRNSSLPTTAAREARLANFRQSVAQDLRSSTPGVPNSGRETPFGASSSSLLGNLEMQRNLMMEQKEADAQRREMQRRDREWQDRVFDSRMRSGDLLGAHREVMRKMQSSAKDQ